MKTTTIVTLLLIAFSANSLWSQIPDGYYDGTTGLTGEPLKSKLHSIIRSHTVKTYSEVKGILRDIDEDPNNSGNIILIYSRRSIDKSDFASNNESDYWNREHTWPKSHGFPDQQDTAYTDVHHLRPCDATINSSRSNKDFNNVDHTAENEQGEAANTYTTGDFWEPTDEIKGDLARTMFYMATRYNSSALDLELVDRISYSGDPELGVLYTLLQWHENDPVSQAEINRNDGAYDYQGNRNPFIDEPTWVAAIWGNSTDPYLSLDQASFSTDFGTVAAGSNLTQQYIVKGYNLTDDINVTVTSPFELSLDDASWSQSITIAKGSASPLETTIYLRFAPEAENEMSYDAIVTHSTSGGRTTEFMVTGTEGTMALIPISEARLKPLNENVNVTGVVISKGNNSSNSRVIFDGSAGIVVRSFDANNESAPLNYGDSITVSGGLSEYNKLLQIEKSPVTIELLKENATLPEPQQVTIDEVNESLESELITVENVEFISTGSFAGGGSSGNFSISDGSNQLVLRIGSSTHPLVGTTIPTGKLTITGIVGQFGSDYQLSPRDVDDIKINSGGEPITGISDHNKNISAYPNPVSTKLYIKGINLDINSYHLRITDINGKNVNVNIQKASSYIDVSKLSTGFYFLYLHRSNEVVILKIFKK